ncbi:MAG: hypothetical protein GKS06_08960 [Acidobacteria bacterium]|nr:hypothetical protein [Acidobacteriota bacterium]
MTYRSNPTQRLALYSLLGAVVALAARPVDAQEIENYLDFMPKSQPRAIKATRASTDLALYGDSSAPGYRDVDPVDGMDDDRARTFHALGRRFAPFLVQNTQAFPINFRTYWENGVDVPLMVDTWNIADVDTSLLARETISVPDLVGNPCSDPVNATGPEDDCTLLRYLRYFSPETPGSQFMTTGVVGDTEEAFRVAYFDMPGVDESSWKTEFADYMADRLPGQFADVARLYMHPLIIESEGAEERYELVLQFWMYYPYNDGGNNHEGDWEHINVVVAPLSQIDRPQTAGEIRSMIDLTPDAVDRDDDPLVIRRVEMYFHHWVQTLDYTSPNVYASHAEWEAEVESREQATRGERVFWRLNRILAYEDEAETTFNTHAVAYIGADNKGIDQLLAAPGGKNRDSHGMYPYPGMYKNIGPLGATEQIDAHWFNPREWYADGSPANTEFGREEALAYHTDDIIEVIPDWERLVDVVQTNPEARARWFWMVMPIRWGYPAVASPGAGIVGDANTGNLGPEGPSYNKSWNRPGEAPSYHAYEPHRLPSLYPLGWQDNFVNSWGFLNITGPTLVTLPPFDFLWRIGTAPVRYALGRPDPVYYPNDELPSRFFGLGPVLSTSFVPTGFAGLMFNENQLTEIVVDLLERDPELIEAGDSEVLPIVETGTGVGAQFGFFLGERFSSENLVRNSRSTIGLDINSPRLDSAMLVRGELNMWEYAGSIRYNLSTGTFKPYAKAGWGLTWYRVENGTVDGEAMDNPNGPWIRKPNTLQNLLPNTVHIGGGAEVMLRRGDEINAAGLDVSVRADWAWYFHGLGLEESAGELLPEVAILVLEGESMNRHQINLSILIGF